MNRSWGINVQTGALEDYLSSAIPTSDFIPLYIVTTNNERIIDVIDSRTWAYEDTGAVQELESRLGSAAYEDTTAFEPSGSVSALQQNLGSAAYEGTTAFDASGSAQAAQDYAVQRSNHTGTQTANTISDPENFQVTTSTGEQTLVGVLDRRLPYFNNVADMVASASLYVGAFVQTLGYYDPGDGGGRSSMPDCRF